jgi:hypothetical protein
MLILANGEAKYFLPKGWTGICEGRPPGKSLRWVEPFAKPIVSANRAWWVSLPPSLAELRRTGSLHPSCAPLWSIEIKAIMMAPSIRDAAR